MTVGRYSVGCHFFLFLFAEPLAFTLQLLDLFGSGIAPFIKCTKVYIELALAVVLSLPNSFDFFRILAPFFAPLDPSFVFGDSCFQVSDISNKIFERKVRGVFGVNGH